MARWMNDFQAERLSKYKKHSDIRELMQESTDNTRLKLWAVGIEGKVRKTIRVLKENMSTPDPIMFVSLTL